MTPLSAVAQVTKKSAQLLTATLYDASLGEAVKQAIEDSGMNLNPQVDGDVVSIPIPKLDKSSREALGKQAKKVAEAAKQRLRRVRKDAMDEVKGVKDDFSEDEVNRTNDIIEVLVEEYSVVVDEHRDAKIEEVMGSE
mmetsp:Transcript_28333/g.58094  ORF Transcript_28333/g.58094 Transcript_28333/m.58094 type:complete len:138 (-) Transcript_28333:246-659(-)